MSDVPRDHPFRRNHFFRALACVLIALGVISILLASITPFSHRHLAAQTLDENTIHPVGTQWNLCRSGVGGAFTYSLNNCSGATTTAPNFQITLVISTIQVGWVGSFEWYVPGSHSLSGLFGGNGIQLVSQTQTINLRCAGALAYVSFETWSRARCNFAFSDYTGAPLGDMAVATQRTYITGTFTPQPLPVPTTTTTTTPAVAAGVPIGVGQRITLAYNSEREWYCNHQTPGGIPLCYEGQDSSGLHDIHLWSLVGSGWSFQLTYNSGSLFSFADFWATRYVWVRLADNSVGFTIDCGTRQTFTNGYSCSLSPPRGFSSPEYFDVVDMVVSPVSSPVAPYGCVWHRTAGGACSSDGNTLLNPPATTTTTTTPSPATTTTTTTTPPGGLGALPALPQDDVDLGLPDVPNFDQCTGLDSELCEILDDAVDIVGSPCEGEYNGPYDLWFGQRLRAAHGSAAGQTLMTTEHIAAVQYNWLLSDIPGCTFSLYTFEQSLVEVRGADYDILFSITATVNDDVARRALFDNPPETFDLCFSALSTGCSVGLRTQIECVSWTYRRAGGANQAECAGRFIDGDKDDFTSLYFGAGDTSYVYLATSSFFEGDYSIADTFRNYWACFDTGADEFGFELTDEYSGFSDWGDTDTGSGGWWQALNRNPFADLVNSFKDAVFRYSGVDRIAAGLPCGIYRLFVPWDLAVQKIFHDAGECDNVKAGCSESNFLTEHMLVWADVINGSPDCRGEEITLFNHEYFNTYGGTRPSADAIPQVIPFSVCPPASGEQPSILYSAGNALRPVASFAILLVLLLLVWSALKHVFVRL